MGIIIRIAVMDFLINNPQIRKRGTPYNYPLFVSEKACNLTQGTDKPSNPNLGLEGVVYPRQHLALFAGGVKSLFSSSINNLSVHI